MAILKKSAVSKMGDSASDKQRDDPSVLRYPKPKILLLDLPTDAESVLTNMGFNVSVGTLGQPYKVPQRSMYQPLLGFGDVPNSSEQEIVAIDLSFGELAQEPSEERYRPEGEPDIWGKCDQGFLDPRVRTAILVSDSFNRILSSGGAFIVFADAKTRLRYQTVRGEYEIRHDNYAIKEDVWHVLAETSDMSVVSDDGTEMTPTGANFPLERLLARHLSGAHFTCTLKGAYRHEDPWVPLAKNKFGDVVALARVIKEGGTVIVVPQIRDKAGFIAELCTTVLPEIAPRLFPNIEQGKWTHWADYELPRVKELEAKQKEIRKRAEMEIAGIEQQVAQERELNGWMHRLITETDTELVNAVKTSLSELGFSKVVDVDEERDRAGKSRREDLQILDRSPTIIVDIKGIGGGVSDDDCLQAGKHAAIRMREENRTDIVGLSIINHQRYLPPLDRENNNPFRGELLDAAEQQSVGLLTSWDLYRLVRNFQALGWRHEDVWPLLYREGRILPIPSHYQFIGTIAKVWTEKFGVNITESDLEIGDKIAVEFSIMFEEVRVDSIHVNNGAVEKANTGDPAGLRWPSANSKLKEGLRVFRIR